MAEKERNKEALIVINSLSRCKLFSFYLFSATHIEMSYRQKSHKNIVKNNRKAIQRHHKTEEKLIMNIYYSHCRETLLDDFGDKFWHNR